MYSKKRGHNSVKKRFKWNTFRIYAHNYSLGMKASYKIDIPLLNFIKQFERNWPRSILVYQTMYNKERGHNSVKNIPME